MGSKADILDRIVDQGVQASGYEQAMRVILALSEPGTVLAALGRTPGRATRASRRR